MFTLDPEAPQQDEWQANVNLLARATAMIRNGRARLLERAAAAAEGGEDLSIAVSVN